MALNRTTGGSDLVFVTRNGTPLNPANVRRDFRKVVDAAGLNGDDWTPREMRHSFVSVLSANDVELKEISLLVGHSGTGVTEKVYRQEIRPVLLKGAEAMDRLPGRGQPARRKRTGRAAHPGLIRPALSLTLSLTPPWSGERSYVLAGGRHWD